MSEYVLARDADRDLDEIWEYIATDSIDAADRLVAKLFEAFELIARMPTVGHRREDLTEHPVRFWTVGTYPCSFRDACAPEAPLSPPGRQRVR